MLNYRAATRRHDKALRIHLHIFPVFVIATASGSRRNTSRRPREAVNRATPVNWETRRGRPARIVLGDPMPEIVRLFMSPAD
jgi:hypothetical protein